MSAPARLAQTAPLDLPREDLAGRPLDMAPLVPLLARIEDALHPVAIWLFGSRARGEAQPGSDWDLCVVVPDGDERLLDPRVGWALGRRAGFHVDVVVCMQSDFEADRDTPNTLANEVTRAGLELRGQ